MRSAPGAVVLAYQSLKRANVSPSGSRTGAIIEHNLQRLTELIDRSLSEVRLQAAPDPPGGTTAVRLRAESDSVALEVEDERGGLPPGATEKLFKPFVRGTRDTTGVGLGLAIVRRAAEANGGTVHVRDKPGEGCVFTIRLPLGARAPVEQRRELGR